MNLFVLIINLFFCLSCVFAVPVTNWKIITNIIFEKLQCTKQAPISEHNYNETRYAFIFIKDDNANEEIVKKIQTFYECIKRYENKNLLHCKSTNINSENSENPDKFICSITSEHITVDTSDEDSDSLESEENGSSEESKSSEDSGSVRIGSGNESWRPSQNTWSIDSSDEDDFDNENLRSKNLRSKNLRSKNLGSKNSEDSGSVRIGSGNESWRPSQNTWSIDSSDNENLGSKSSGSKSSGSKSSGSKILNTKKIRNLGVNVILDRLPHKVFRCDSLSKSNLIENVKQNIYLSVREDDEINTDSSNTGIYNCKKSRNFDTDKQLNCKFIMFDDDETDNPDIASFFCNPKVQVDSDDSNVSGTSSGSKSKTFRPNNQNRPQPSTSRG